MQIIARKQDVGLCDGQRGLQARIDTLMWTSVWARLQLIRPTQLYGVSHSVFVDTQTFSCTLVNWYNDVSDGCLCLISSCLCSNRCVFTYQQKDILDIAFFVLLAIPQIKVYFKASIQGPEIVSPHMRY